MALIFSHNQPVAYGFGIVMSPTANPEPFLNKISKFRLHLS